MITSKVLLQVERPAELRGAFAFPEQNRSWDIFLIEQGLIPLPKEHLEWMRQYFERDEELRELLFSLRDPIDRCEALAVYLAERYGILLSAKYIAQVVRRILPHYLGGYTVMPPSAGYPADFRLSYLPHAVRESGDLHDLYTRAKIRELYPLFVTDPEAGMRLIEEILAETQDEKLKQLLLNVRDPFAKALTIAPREFRRKLPDGTFPAFHQQLAAAQFLKVRRVIVAHGPGTGKTGVLFLCHSLSGGKGLLIVPKGAVDEVLEKIRLYYRRRPEIVFIGRAERRIERGKARWRVVVIETSQVGEEALPILQDRKTHLILTNYEILIRRIPGGKRTVPADPLSSLGHLLCSLRLKFLGLDEAHRLRNFASSTQSQAVVEIARRTQPPWVCCTTATPMYDGPEDLGPLAYLCQPDIFETPRGFERIRRADPAYLRSAFFSEHVHFAPVTNLFPLPPLDLTELEEPRRIEMSPAQLACYLFLHSVTEMEPLTKLRLLRQASFAPQLLRGKPVTIVGGWGREETTTADLLPFDDVQAKRQLLRAFERWQRQRAAGDRREFTVNYLCEEGFSNLYLSCLFHLAGGVAELVRRVGRPEIEAAFVSVIESGKFRHILEIIRHCLAEGKGCVIVSSLFKEGFTDEEEAEPDWEAYAALVELVRKHFPDLEAIALDGDIPPRERKKLRERWQREPVPILLFTAPSTAEAVECSTKAEKPISEVVMVLLDLPWTPGTLQNLTARVHRRGQHHPVKVVLLEHGGGIDEGVRRHLRRKQEDIAFFERGHELAGADLLRWQRTATAIKQTIPEVKSPGLLLRWLFNAMRNKPSAENVVFLASLHPETGLTFGELLASTYRTYQAHGLPSRIARCLTTILTALERRGINVGRTVDVGSGPSTLQNSLTWPITSVDFCPEMFLKDDEGRGTRVVAFAHKLPFASESFEVVVASLLLDQLLIRDDEEDERIAALQEFARILQKDGTLLLTFQEGALTPEYFASWQWGLERLGFSIGSFEERISGLIVARGPLGEERQEERFWLLAARQGGRKLRPKMRDFLLPFEVPHQFFGGVDLEERRTPPFPEVTLFPADSFLVVDPHKKQPRGVLTELLESES